MVLEDSGLLDTISVELMLDYLLLQHLVTELKLINTINEVLLRNKVDGALRARTHYRRPSVTRILNYFLKTEYLIHPYEVQSKPSRLDRQNRLLVRHLQVERAFRVLT